MDGVSGVKFIARRWLQIEFDSHRMAALARRQLVPGNQTMFGHVLIKQVDWADPEENLLTGVDNKVISVRGIVASVSEAEIKHWFNILTEGQVDNVVRSEIIGFCWVREGSKKRLEYCYLKWVGLKKVLFSKKRLSKS